MNNLINKSSSDINLITGYIDGLKALNDNLIQQYNMFQEEKCNLKQRENELENKLVEINEFKKVSVYKSLSDQLCEKDLEIEILTKKLKFALRRQTLNDLDMESINSVEKTSIKVEELSNDTLIDGGEAEEEEAETLIVEEEEEEERKEAETLIVEEEEEEERKEAETLIVEEEEEEERNEAETLIVEEEEQQAETLIVDEEEEERNEAETLIVEEEEQQAETLIVDEEEEVTTSTNHEGETSTNRDIDFFEESVNGKSYYFGSDGLIYKKLRDGSIGKRKLGTFKEDDLGNLDIDWKKN
uniref:Uncharacterized protein n=1 Tax=viral metagenome TaxID=1070528 RepID=A0A6C0EJS3_9ZZZZ